MDPRNVIGSLKAAILVQALGWDVISPIMNQLSKTERNLVFKLQSKLGNVSAALVEGVAREFLEKAIPPKQIESKEKTEADGADDNALEGQREKKLKAIQAIPPDALIQLIQNEHPQTISLIIAHLQPHIASDVMGLLPDEIKSDVACRIANLDKIASGMLEEIDNVLEEILANKDTSTTQKAGGVPRLAEILNMIDGTSAEQIIEEIEENDPDLAEEIRQNMFVFDDIVLVDDRGLQKVLRSVESQELAVALKASTDEVKEKIFRNMSERAAEILKEEMEVSGAIRIKDVTDAQQKVTKIVQDMERKGELVISGRGGRNLLDNSPKNDRLSSTEPCALYYFPEIPSATSRQNQTAKPGRFTSGSFKCSDDQASQKGTNQDAEQIQALIEEAFNKGLEQGRVETKVVQEEQVNNAVAALEAGIQEIHRVRRHDVERMETETVRLALAITKKVIGYETEHHAVVQHVVKQAMEKVNDTRSFTLKLNPRDLDAVKDLHNDLLPADDLGVVFRIEADEAIKRGGCVIETKLGDIDARIDRQIKIIEELLIDQVPKSTAQE